MSIEQISLILMGVFLVIGLIFFYPILASNFIFIFIFGFISSVISFQLGRKFEKARRVIQPKSDLIANMNLQLAPIIQGFLQNQINQMKSQGKSDEEIQKALKNWETVMFIANLLDQSGLSKMILGYAFRKWLKL